ncbi:MAG: hypothetical protein GQ551_03560, partial [Myxococcales bacterium]|nr:hypothetical protein [Myxococcales bacterium]
MVLLRRPGTPVARGIHRNRRCPWLLQHRIWSADVEDHPQAGLTGSAIPIDDMVIIGVSSGEVGNTDPEYDYTFRGSIV